MNLLTGTFTHIGYNFLFEAAEEMRDNFVEWKEWLYIRINRKGNKQSLKYKSAKISSYFSDA